ncbi:unnamed protein product [Victoria cruziana]
MLGAPNSSPLAWREKELGALALRLVLFPLWFLSFICCLFHFLFVSSSSICILQVLSEWRAYWVLGGVPHSSFQSIKSGEHTFGCVCSIWRVEAATGQQPIHGADSSMLSLLARG